MLAFQEGQTPLELKAESEDEAFALLDRAVGDAFAGQAVALDLSKMPPLRLLLDGPGYKGVLNIEMMEGLVEFQKALTRAYAGLMYGYPSATHLKEEERQRLQFKVQVREGSTVAELLLSEPLTEVAKEMVKKMDGNQLVIVILGLALAFASKAMWQAYLNRKMREKELDAQIQQHEQILNAQLQASEAENKRLAIFAEAMTREPRLAAARQEADEARVSVIRGVGDADSLAIEGVVELPRGVAKAMSRAKRAESIEDQMNAPYRILGVDQTAPGEVRLRLLNLDNGRDFSAKFTDESLDGRQIELLKDAEWSRKPVFLNVNVLLLRGVVNQAVIIKVRAHEPSETTDIERARNSPAA